jgi:3',5'-cyclic-nucleotide phosphodiesterase/cAMP-specific phosphodiesterase 4
LILATDLAKHFEVLRKLRRLVRDKDAGGASLLEEDSRCVVLQCCLKVADIGHNAKPVRLHKQWTGMLHKEFFCQGDLERKLGFSVTPLFNRDAINIAEAQRGFLTIVAIPLFETWEQFMDSDDTENDPLQPSRRLLTQQARKNVQFWEEELEHPTFYLDEAPPFSLLPDTSSNDNL